MATDWNAYVTNLYGNIGKTPDLIDQPGLDFWTNKFSTGQATPQDFYNSAHTVYNNPDSYTTSPYATQNTMGQTNLALAQMPPGGAASGAGGLLGGGGSQIPTNLPSYNTPTLNTQYMPSSQLNGVIQGISSDTNNWLGGALNDIGSHAIGAGGLGGSRQGVAQGIAEGQAAKMYDNAVANVRYGDYNNQMNRNLQQYGIDTGADTSRYGTDAGIYGNQLNYNLGQQGIGLGYQNAADNFYTSQRGQDIQSYLAGIAGYQAGVNGPWSPINNANGVFNDYTGFGTTTGTQQQGGGGMGALGGALGAWQLANLFGK